MDIVSGGRELGSDAAAADEPARPAIDEATLVKQARSAFRFGPDGRLLTATRPAPPAAPAPDAPGDARPERASDDPVLDECFETALVLDLAPGLTAPAAAPADEAGGTPAAGPAVDPAVVDGDGVEGAARSAATVADGPEPATGAVAAGDPEAPVGGSAPAGAGEHPTEAGAPADDEGVAPAATAADDGTDGDGDPAGGRDSDAGPDEDHDAFVAGAAALRQRAGGTAEAADRPGPSTRPAGAAADPDDGDADGPPVLRWPEPGPGLPKPSGEGGAERDGADVLTTVLGSSPDVELAFARSLGSAGAPMGLFGWPSGSALWANDALDGWLAVRPSERTLVAVLDEWSQAHFLVRVLPELLRLGRWRGELRFAAPGGRTASMLVTLVGHHDPRGGTDAVTLLAMPVAPTAGSVVPPVEPGVQPEGPGSTFGNGLSPTPADQLFHALVQHVSDLIVVTDADGRVTFASPAAQSLLDLAPVADDVRPSLLAILHPDQRPASLAELARRPDEGHLPAQPLRVLGSDGTWRDLAAVLTDLTGSSAVGGYVLNARDVTAEVRAEQSITDLAYTDALTGLANRVRLLDRLEAQAQAVPPAPNAVVVLGLDHLRRIDAQHGAAMVDAVLRSVGERLGATAATLGPGVLAARLHSDEFAVLLPGVGEVGGAVAAAGRIRLALRDPITVGDHQFAVTASMGAAATGPDGTTEGFDDILVRADLAMREAKARGRDRTVAYDERLGATQQQRRGIDQQLRRAIESDGLRIQFQPIVELATGSIVGAEALLRVRGDDGELLSPAAFVEAAESNGLISRLGAAVLRTTCEQATALDLRHGGLPISVNVSPRQIADPGFARRVLTILDETGLAPDRLSLEITEGAFVGHDDVSETNIIGLRDEGVRLGLDEFGGDASLGYLRRFPLDFLKVDRRLVAGLGVNYVDAAIVRATIELAHKLGLVTVAVGVEQEEQRRRLEQAGCDRAQGFLFGGAMSSIELSALLRRGR